MQAPFEAEAQCVRLQKDGHVQYVMSDDGDCFAYRVETWITMCNMNTGDCCILDSRQIRRTQTSMSRANIEKVDKRVRDQFTTAKIRQANKRKLDGWGGPDESATSKRRQLEMLDRLSSAATKGKVPRTLLSHYAAVSSDTRKETTGAASAC